MGYLKREPFVPSPETVIWRYMDGWKFEELLKRFSEHEKWQQQEPGTRTVHFNDPGQLWFAFPSAFGDDKEGRFPDLNEDPKSYCDRMASLMGLSDEESARRQKRFLNADTKAMQDAIFFMAQLCGVSSWHVNTSEAADMWTEFVAEKNGVTIRSTCQQVEHGLSYAHNSPARRSSPSVCAVGYVDHSDYFLPHDDYRSLLSIVQESYSHENEVRFVAKSFGLATIPSTMKVQMPIESAAGISDEEEWIQRKSDFLTEYTNKIREAYIQNRTSNLDGFNLPVSLSGLFSEVVLAHGCSPKFEREVSQLLNDADCGDVPVRRSTI